MDRPKRQQRGGPPSEPPAETPVPAEPFPMHEHIGRQLKIIFDEIVTQPIPKKLVDLLDELERKQPPKTK